jgi:hypothetical protein
LEAFLRDYPSGDRHAQIYRHLDDVAWQKTDKSEVTSLQSYAARFPDGKHVGEARSDLDALTQSMPMPAMPSIPVVDYRVAVLEVIAQFNRAYNDRSIDELKNIWPSMDKRQIASQRDFFKTASSVTSTYRIDEGPQISGDEATVKFTQVVTYMVKGTSQKISRNWIRVVKLRRVESRRGTPGGWKINSM